MTFRRNYFEDFSDNVDGIVYFAHKSRLNPLRIGTIKLKLVGFLDFLVHVVLYLSWLQRSLLSLVHIQQQGHSIHIFDGIIEIRRTFDNKVMMIGVEDGRLLRLKGISTYAQSFTYLTHKNETTLSSNLLCHARFGHINYDSLRLLKKNGVFILPTIPRKLKQGNPCILGKHTKHPFYGSTTKACRKLGLIHSYLCDSMIVQSTNVKSFGKKKAQLNA